MSPEQLLGRSVDGRTDIFSLGIVLYEMLEGRSPFVKDNDVDTMHAILHEEVELPEGISDPLATILGTMLNKAASKRYQTAEDLIDALRMVHDPLLGLRIKDYRLLRAIGRGGQGKVYLAHGDETAVALKLLLSDESIKPEARERFRLEGKVSKYLDHKNIVKVHHYGEAVIKIREENKVLYFIVMDYIKGMDLETLISLRKVPNLGEAIGIVCDVLSALSYAHGTGLIHRDVKARNVLISELGEIKLADFGLCKYNAEYSAQTSFSFSSLTDSNTLMGSPHYMSPEQIKAKEVDYRSDIYSCGVVLFYLTTHQLPFRGDNFPSILLNILSEPTPNPRKLNTNISDSLATAIMKMLEKDPSKRFQSCEEAFEYLQRCPEAKDFSVSTLKDIVEVVSEQAPSVFTVLVNPNEAETIPLD
jgi:serine/threonine protein kinase